MFSCEFYEIFKNTFFIEHLRWLFLYAVAAIFICVIKVKRSWNRFHSGRAMENWKVLSATMAGRQENVLDPSCSRMAKKFKVFEKVFKTI